MRIRSIQPNLEHLKALAEIAKKKTGVDYPAILANNQSAILALRKKPDSFHRVISYSKREGGVLVDLKDSAAGHLDSLLSVVTGKILNRKGH